MGKLLDLGCILGRGKAVFVCSDDKAGETSLIWATNENSVIAGLHTPFKRTVPVADVRK